MKRNSKLLRTLSVLAVIALVCLGLALHTGTGTPSAWGIYDIAAICPLGAAEAALASKTVVPPMLIALAIGIALVVLFGRAFCAWGCPIPLLRRIFGLKEPKRKRRASDALDVPAAQRGGAADSRNWVLGGALLSTAVFGFPVFCLICPVGLTFATLIAVWRLFQFNEVALSLLVFPAMLALEVLVLRKWCSRFCPLGALLSLVSRLNKTFRPVINEGDVPMPFSFGYHPYFTASALENVDFDIRCKTCSENAKGEQPAAPEKITLTRKEGADNTIRLMTGVEFPMSFTDKGNGHKVTVDADDSFNNGVLWQQDAESFVCMEPWNGWANSVNEEGKHEVLEPDEALTSEWTITIEKV